MIVLPSRATTAAHRNCRFIFLTSIASMAMIVSAFAFTALPIYAAPPAQGALPAFPGAEGWGRNAKGGGQNSKTQVLMVTSLEDSGPGTLREALKARGPRIVVFKTGGVIDLKGKLTIQAGDLTVAAQTAPGDGVIVKSFPIRIAANNVIMRGFRIRPGDGPGPKGDLRDGIQLGNADGTQIHDVIVDHCSFGWCMNETAEFWYGCRNMTMSYCVLSEALWKSKHPKGTHGYAMLLGDAANDQVTISHNLFAHNERRNPWVKMNAKCELINNVIYNYASEATGLWLGEPKPAADGTARPAPKPCFVNLIGNTYKRGEALAKQKIPKRPIGLGKIPAPGSRFYIHDNIGYGRTDGKQDDWDAVEAGQFDVAPYRAKEPLTEAASGMTPQKAAEGYETVLKHAGSYPRDKADARAAEDTRTTGGKHLDALSEIGGYPAYAVGTPPPDADNDGIPDDWERAHNLNPNDKSDATKLAASGYLNIEEYINSLIPLPEAASKP